MRRRGDAELCGHLSLTLFYPWEEHSSHNCKIEVISLTGQAFRQTMLLLLIMPVTHLLLPILAAVHKGRVSGQDLSVSLPV